MKKAKYLKSSFDYICYFIFFLYYIWLSAINHLTKQHNNDICPYLLFLIFCLFWLIVFNSLSLNFPFYFSCVYFDYFSILLFGVIAYIIFSYIHSPLSSILCNKTYKNTLPFRLLPYTQHLPIDVNVDCKIHKFMWCLVQYYMKQTPHLEDIICILLIFTFTEIYIYHSFFFQSPSNFCGL